MAQTSRRRPPLFRSLFGLLVFFLIVATLATAKGADPRLYPPAPNGKITLFLVDNGFHTDLVFPRAVLIAHGGPLAQATALTTTDPWVMVGWGDEKFYEARDGLSFARALDGLRALFAPGNRSVVHLEGDPWYPPQAWRTGLHPIVVSSAGLAAMLARIDRSFAPGPGGQPLRSPVHRDHDEMFFASGESFSLFHICNHWTAQALNAAGLPVTPVIDTMPAGLVLDLKLRAHLS
jgi:hypothetical protein